MALTEEQKEIALRVAKDAFNTESHRAWSYEGGDANVLEFASSFLAALPKPEPICEAALLDEWFLAKSGIDPTTPLYTEAPFTPPANKQSPIAWATTNEDGDYSMLFFDKQEARSYSGDDEPVGLAPVSLGESEPEYKARRDALLELLQSAVEELREMKQVVGFRTNTLEVIEKCDAAIAAAKGEK